MSNAKRTGTKKMAENTMNDIQLRNADMEDQYVEKPRPNLYNVIRKLQESNGQYINRIVVLSKIDEHAIKNPESNYHDWI